jgi:hypothetical protein
MATAFSSEKILDLLRQPRWTGLSKGKVNSMQDRLQRARGERTGDRTRLLQELYNRPTTSGPGVTHLHPEAEARHVRRESSDDLTPAELLWLQRLPLDPAAVTHDDAVQLASMNAGLAASKSPSSKRLVESVWLPVKTLHDQRVADDELASLRQGLAPVPASAHAALTEAIATEHPDWPSGATSSAATELLDKAVARRAADHESAVAKAQATVDRLKQEAIDRAALTRHTA